MNLIRKSESLYAQYSPKKFKNIKYGIIKNKQQIKFET